ncbi:MAG: hypothetical protein IMX00_09515 [Limnochordales bacterium]|nr:hypothetical protein [Limnochordales bacterium]
MALARLYLRARDEVAWALWDVRHRHEAIQRAEAVLELNPHAAQGTRFYLSNWYPRLQMTEKAGKLLNRYLPGGDGPDSRRTSVAYGRALWLHQQEGASPAARQALEHPPVVLPS